LYDFLAHCACDEDRDADGYYWIDTLRQVVHVRTTCVTNANFAPNICSINQGGLEERSGQVKLMSKIYQAAVAVIVWLGPEDNLTKLAIDLMHGVLQLEESDR
jgi:hypothetical protein